MPMFSIIVPIYKVEDWLDECLGSILAQSFADFELIAVDDCSPDNSAAIVRHYAQHDRRVRVVTLEQNVGLGLARNAGLEQATGEYIWFVDSDDWINPGSLQAIADRARNTDADIVMFGWERRHPDGRRKRAGEQHLYASAPDVFKLADFPQLVLVPPFSWNKAVRRDLIEKYHYQFTTGQYQDIDYSYLVLAAANKISILDQICVNYRQRNTAVTRTASNKHFSVFDHWERSFLLIEQHGVSSPEIVELMFMRMNRNITFIYNHASRLPKASRKAFIATAKQIHHRFRPERPARPPTRSEHLTQALLARGAYPLLEGRRRFLQFKSVLRRKLVGA